MVFMLWVWGAAALTAGAGYLMNATKPAPTGAAGIIAAIPIWGWIVIALLGLVLIKSR